jgi:hypothetical protein
VFSQAPSTKPTYNTLQTIAVTVSIADMMPNYPTWVAMVSNFSCRGDSTSASSLVCCLM